MWRQLAKECAHNKAAASCRFFFNFLLFVLARRHKAVQLFKLTIDNSLKIVHKVILKMIAALTCSIKVIICTVGSSTFINM